MSITDEPIDLTTLKTREQVVAHYRELFPLLAAYLDVLDEHQGPPCAINEPWTGGIDERAAARMALARTGRPPRDHADVVFALAHIREIQSEMATLYPPTDPTIQSYVIGEFFQYAGCVPTAENWLDDNEYPVSERDGYLFNIVQAIAAGELPALLQECLRHAMPSILRKITAEDEARRRPGLSMVDG
jgi:hypothetical protein